MLTEPRLHPGPRTGPPPRLLEALSIGVHLYAICKMWTRKLFGMIFIFIILSENNNEEKEPLLLYQYWEKRRH